MQRRDILKWSAAAVAGSLPVAAIASRELVSPEPTSPEPAHQIEQWGLFELALRGPSPTADIPD